MSKNLIIVESPAKAKTIQKFIGKDFSVISSKGHVCDLPQKDLGIDVTNNFEPKYIVLDDKKALINDIRKKAQEADVIWLATDDDREGEAISWHLMQVTNMDPSKVRRIVFHEITKSAIENALANPRTLNLDLVNAQQARRVLDRLVGFELSPVLWRKVKPQLSAGRVQSVAVKLIVEREHEIERFNSTSSYKVEADFVSERSKEIRLAAELNKKFTKKEDATRFLEECKSAEFHVAAVEKSPGKRSPAPPFTTSTLQQEAARKLGFSVSKTMVVAQQLYEAGYITYMRTDSVNLSAFALATAKEVITELYGAEYSHLHNFVTKTKGAQEAHEAIRPTDLSRQTVPGDTFVKHLYELIWKRTIASQMSDAKTEKTSITIPVSNRTEKFVATGEVILFPGFLKVYAESKDEENEEVKGLLPVMQQDERLEPQVITATQRFAQPPARYTEASLVKKLEELGIGRPSTYAPTITTIQKRGYVQKATRPGKERQYVSLALKNGVLKEEERSEKYGYEKDKIFPTDVGIVVNEYLQDNFQNIMDYGFTADVEKDFDEIAEGKVQWNEAIATFYKLFHPIVEETVQMRTERKAGERVLGRDPKSGKQVSVKIGRYGAMAQIGTTDDEEKPQFASLQKTQSIETITLEETLKLFELPRTLGAFREKDVVVGVGRFGPYIRHNNKFVSLPKGVDPLEIELEEAIVLIEAKEQKDREKLILSFEEEPELQVLNGRYGPYITYQKGNYKIPKGVKPEELTLEECRTIIEEADKEGKATGRGRRGASAKKAATTAAAGKSSAKKSSTKKSSAKKSTTKKSTAKKSTTAKATAAKKSDSAKGE